MLASGQTPTYMTQSVGISENSNYRWKSRYNQMVKKSVLSSLDLMLENQQLRQRVAQLETERDVLKKLWAFSSDSCKFEVVRFSGTVNLSDLCNTHSQTVQGFGSPATTGAPERCFLTRL